MLDVVGGDAHRCRAFDGEQVGCRLVLVSGRLEPLGGRLGRVEIWVAPQVDRVGVAVLVLVLEDERQQPGRFRIGRAGPEAAVLFDRVVRAGERGVDRAGAVGGDHVVAAVAPEESSHGGPFGRG